jgi:hypothetical protein
VAIRWRNRLGLLPNHRTASRLNESFTPIERMFVGVVQDA